MLLVLIAITFAVALLRFDGPAKGYWDTYITAPAMFMNRQPVDFVLKDGSPAWDVQLDFRTSDYIPSASSSTVPRVLLGPRK